MTQAQPVAGMVGEQRVHAVVTEHLMNNLVNVPCGNSWTQRCFSSSQRQQANVLKCALPVGGITAFDYERISEICPITMYDDRKSRE